MVSKRQQIVFEAPLMEMTAWNHNKEVSFALIAALPLNWAILNHFSAPQWKSWTPTAAIWMQVIFQLIKHIDTSKQMGDFKEIHTLLSAFIKSFFGMAFAHQGNGHCIIMKRGKLH